MSSMTTFISPLARMPDRHPQNFREEPVDRLVIITSYQPRYANHVISPVGWVKLSLPQKLRGN
jgi:hypothetical protein